MFAKVFDLFIFLFMQSSLLIFSFSRNSFFSHYMLNSSVYPFFSRASIQLSNCLFIVQLSAPYSSVESRTNIDLAQNKTWYRLLTLRAKESHFAGRTVYVSIDTSDVVDFTPEVRRRCAHFMGTTNIWWSIARVSIALYWQRFFTWDILWIYLRYIIIYFYCQDDD